MRMIDIINKKRDGFSLSKEEIEFWVNGYVKGEIPAYQVSALLMAILLKGMDIEETTNLTLAMMNSGEIIDLSMIDGITIDKHSTGGVGDKTTLVLAPMLASCGLKVAKMSGRGLAHTGGTLDKLESIPHLNVYQDKHNFIKQVNDIGLAVIGQTTSLVPADKKLYALRDVTGTVNSIPLIASSIMSKKLASGNQIICLDVTVGSGAFMKDLSSAKKLAQTMVDIGKKLNRNVIAIISDMDEPLGNAIGNQLEIIEVVNTLLCKGPKDLEEICYFFGEQMLVQSGLYSNVKEAHDKLVSSLSNGEAFNKFCQMVNSQCGDYTYILHTDKFPKSKYIVDIPSKDEGYIHHLDAHKIGVVSMKLGAGREKIEDEIDHKSGIILNKKIGDYVKKGETLLTIHTDKENYAKIFDEIYSAYEIKKESHSRPSLIKAIIS